MKNIIWLIMAITIPMASAQTILTLTHTEQIQSMYFDEDSTPAINVLFSLVDLVDGGGELSMLMWDITAIPANANITNATLYLTTNTGGGSTQIIEIWYSNNLTWTPAHVRDGLCGAGPTTPYCDTFGNNIWFNQSIRTFNGTGSDNVVEVIGSLQTLVQLAYNQSHDNVTILINMTAGQDTNDFFRFYSRNETTITNRPVFNITYEAEASEDACACPAGNFNIGAGDNCIISAPCDMAGRNVTVQSDGNLTITSELLNIHELILGDGSFIDIQNGANLTCKAV